MRRFTLVVLAVCVLSLGLPAMASAGCTASLNCANGCFLGKECPAPYQPWWISCGTGDQVLSCSGQTSCLVGSNYIECDGRRWTCSSFWCIEGSDYVKCGNSSMSCQQCQNGTYNCIL